jgi:hypothetical protein
LKRLKQAFYELKKIQELCATKNSAKNFFRSLENHYEYNGKSRQENDFD